MKYAKYINGQYVDLTAEEIAAMQAEGERLAEVERNRPPTVEERLAAMEAAMLTMMEGNANV